jgi:hypothetical protein
MGRISKLIVAVAMLNFMVSGAAALDTPPAEFDRPANNMRIWHYSAAKVSDLCQRLVTHRDNPYRLASTGGRAIGGCAVGGTAQCILILPVRSSVSAESYDRLYRHERAHCNGWRH